MIAGYKSCLLSSWFGMKADRLPPPPPGVDLELADPGAGVGPRWPIGARTGNLGAGAGQGGQRGHTARSWGAERLERRCGRSCTWESGDARPKVWPRGGGPIWRSSARSLLKPALTRENVLRAGVLWAISGYDP